MKRIIVTSFLILFYSFYTNAQSLHNISITNIDGGIVNLNSYAGSKILILIAPLRPEGMISIKEIDSFRVKYGNKIKIIAVMSKEDGFVDSNKNIIKSYYQSLGTNFILTSGMFTQKAAGSNQSPLFKWLTDISLNQHFDVDAQGIGQKFFIDATGKLYEVLLPAMPLFAEPVLMTLKRKM